MPLTSDPFALKFGLPFNLESKFNLSFSKSFLSLIPVVDVGFELASHDHKRHVFIQSWCKCILFYHRLFQNTGNKFSIDSSTGSVLVDERLDYETQAFYPLIVRATVRRNKIVFLQKAFLIWREFVIFLLKECTSPNSFLPFLDTAVQLKTCFFNSLYSVDKHRKINLQHTRENMVNFSILWAWLQIYKEHCHIPATCCCICGKKNLKKTWKFIFFLLLEKLQKMCSRHVLRMSTMLQDNGAVPQSSQAFLNITVRDENDNSAAFLFIGCQTDNRGFCVNPLYSASIISSSLVGYSS